MSPSLGLDCQPCPPPGEPLKEPVPPAVRPRAIDPSPTAATLPPEMWKMVWHGLDAGFHGGKERPEIHRAGACKCGKLKFRVDGNLAACFLCHCHMCRRYWGQETPSHIIWVQPADAVTITEGIKYLKTWTMNKLSHNLRGEGIISFASCCGTNINVNFSDPNGTFTLMWPYNFTHDEWGDLKTQGGNKARHGLDPLFQPRFHAHYENRARDHEDSLPKLADIWFEDMPMMNNKGDIVGKVSYPMPGFERGWAAAPTMGYYAAGITRMPPQGALLANPAGSPAPPAGAARAMERAGRIAQQVQPEAVGGDMKLTVVSETENVRYERDGSVAVITLVRTKALNALCDALIADLGKALRAAEEDKTCGCVVLTGSGRAFAAGADIKEMAPKDFEEVTSKDPFAAWACLADCRLPIIAAVNGFAFGGGCEIAMMCDIIVASEKAVFGQPEIKLGVIPGVGGTQRLVRSIGKSKAMDLILTGRNMSAQDAEKAGLVAEVVPPEQLMPTAMKKAAEIAGFGRLSTLLAKEAVNSAYETTLQEGVHLEKKLFYSLFGTQDKKEGMDAFINKRKANFTHK